MIGVIEDMVKNAGSEDLHLNLEQLSSIRMEVIYMPNEFEIFQYNSSRNVFNYNPKFIIESEINGKKLGDYNNRDTIILTNPENIDEISENFPDYSLGIVENVETNQYMESKYPKVYVNPDLIDKKSNDTPYEYYNLFFSPFVDVENSLQKCDISLIDDIRINTENYNIEELYRDLWLKPLKSVEEIKIRQNFYEELVTNKDYLKNMRNLGEGLINFNDRYAEFLMCMDILKFEHYKGLYFREIEQYYYNNFHSGHIGYELDEKYKNVENVMLEIKEHTEYLIGNIENIHYFLNNFTPKSEESKFIHYSLHSIINSKSLKEDYKFLKNLKQSKISNYKVLTQFFDNELKKLNIKNPYDYYKNKVEINDISSDEIGLIKVNLLDLPGNFKVLNMSKYIGERITAYGHVAEFMEDNFVKPIICDKNEGIHIEQGWDPLIHLQKYPIVPNDTDLNSESRIEILNGKNANGKTTDLKKTLHITQMASTGMLVPAKKAKIALFDDVFYIKKSKGINTRNKNFSTIGQILSGIDKPIHDDIVPENENGALLSELSYIKPIFDIHDKGNRHILVGFDEIFTSTNYKEGSEFLEMFIKKLEKNEKTYTIFATHFNPLKSELTKTYLFLDGHVKVLKNETSINPFYGLEYAEEYGLNKKIVEHAKKFEAVKNE